jgi:hypothetical protein
LRNWRIVILAKHVIIPSSRLLSTSSADSKSVVRQMRRYQQDPVLLCLPKLYPPDGEVPDRVPTETVRQRVLAELAHENEELIRRGVPPVRGPSWETVHRALGRDKQRRN